MLGVSDLGTIPARVAALRAREGDRDRRHWEVQEARRGNFEHIAPDLFSDEFRRPIVANLIDTAARDAAAMIAPLPAFNCSAASLLNEKAKKFADTRTKIARNYVEASKLELQMARKGADHLNSFGLILGCIEPDFEAQAPRWRVESPIGAYPVLDPRTGRCRELARVFYQDWFALCASYPQLERLKEKYPSAVVNSQVEVVKYVSDRRIVVYLPFMGETVLEDMANPLGKCYYFVGLRPNFEDEAKGAYDDVIYLQLARHRLAMLLLEGTEKAVRAPTIVPEDVDELALGPDAVLRTRHGAGSIGKVRLDVPPQAFAATEQLKAEQREGSMSPEGRSGSIDASVITGRGMAQLMEGFSSQIAVSQTVLRSWYADGVQMSFEMDEKLFGGVQKEIRGNDSGVPYSIKYRPSKDIDGDHTVDISYGFAAGMDPNRVLVYLLQADAAGLVSKDYVRRNLPVDINASEEERRIAIEQSRQAIVLAFSALAQSIPEMAAGGMDPLAVISQQAKFVELLSKGKTIEAAAAEALKPPEPPPAPPGAPAEPGAPPGPGGSPGLPPGLAAEGPNGRPDLAQLFAGMSAGGAPQLSAGVSRLNPVAGQ